MQQEQDEFQRNPHTARQQHRGAEAWSGASLTVPFRCRLYNALVLRSLLRRGEVLIVLAAVAARAIPGPRTIDDAYITYRYAQNLLQGQGLVFNPGERVLGTTTPAYAIVLAGAGLLAGGAQANFPLLSLLINALADGLTCWLLPRLGDKLGQRGAGQAAALVWAIAPWSVTFAIGGMETSLLVALATATFYLHLTDRPVGAALCGALALLTRPDSLIFLLPIALARGWQALRAARTDERTIPLGPAEALAVVVPLGAWTLASTAYYGSPLPNSILAKAIAYRLGPMEGLGRLVQHYATPFVEHELLGPGWIRIGLPLYVLLFLLGAATALRVNRRAWPVLLYPLLYFVVFAAANPLLFRWYLTPPLPVYFLGIFLGAGRLAADLKTAAPMLLVATFAVASTAAAWTVRPDHGPARPAPRMAYIELELLYLRAAQVLESRLGPGQVVASADIGALGYSTRAPVLDLLGLISPQVQEYYPLPESMYVINFAIAPEAVIRFRPEFVVLPEVYGRNGLLLDQRFLDAYQLLTVLPTDIYSSRGLLIYELDT
jgi:hypothetical protein